MPDEDLAAVRFEADNDLRNTGIGFEGQRGNQGQGVDRNHNGFQRVSQRFCGRDTNSQTGERPRAVGDADKTERRSLLVDLFEQRCEGRCENGGSPLICFQIVRRDNAITAH